MNYQPRFVAYSNSLGLTPEQTLKLDRERYPGGCMCGFILWISRRIKSFKLKHPEAFIGNTLHDQTGFTLFLFNK